MSLATIEKRQNRMDFWIRKSTLSSLIGTFRMSSNVYRDRLNSCPRVMRNLGISCCRGRWFAGLLCFLFTGSTGKTSSWPFEPTASRINSKDPMLSLNSSKMATYRQSKNLSARILSSSSRANIMASRAYLTPASIIRLK